jgi:hypothetical protein
MRILDPGLRAEIVGRSAGHKEQTEGAMTSAYQIGTEIKGRGSLGLHEPRDRNAALLFSFTRGRSDRAFPQCRNNGVVLSAGPSDVRVACFPCELF